MTWRLIFHRSAQRDFQKLEAAGLRPKVELLLELIREDPFRQPPPFEKLRGDLKGMYSRRINVRHRLVYDAREDDRVVRVLGMWSHYE